MGYDDTENKSADMVKRFGETDYRTEKRSPFVAY